MDTNRIKSFAKEARLILMDGVLQRLKYWGFNIDGSIDQNLQSTQGGYIFRGQVFTDASVPGKWNKLKKRISNKQDVKDVVEEAAYTWFNRLMAIKVLEVNGYIPHVLEFTKDIRTPVLVQNAKRGQHNLTKQSDKDLLIEYLKEDKEEHVLGLLLTELCNTNNLLHDVFGRIDDYTEILLPQNLLQKDGIIELINNGAISDEDYKEVELIGWLYQFYISDKKDEVFAGFKKNKKARAEDIPAATQIFTPKWIVKYMVENTVGKIYLDYEPNSNIKQDLKYLVVNESDKDSTPIISEIKELTLLDPACGSGHILVSGFELLFKMYREEGYSAKQAVDCILKYNLFGLDIDDRAMQLARFAVLLKAAIYDADVLRRDIIPHVYSFPEDIISDFLLPENYSTSVVEKEYLGYRIAEDISKDWIESFKDDDTGEVIKIERSEIIINKGDIISEEIIKVLKELNIPSIKVYSYFKINKFLETSNIELLQDVANVFDSLRLGKNVGSALKVSLNEEAYAHVKKQYAFWLQRYRTAGLDIEQTIIWTRLQPFLDVLLILTKQYTTVVANPPYMGQKSMNGELKDYLNTHYPLSKSDLFAVFIEAMTNILQPNARVGCITMESWMFLSSYEKLRLHLLDNYSIVSLAHFGWHIIGIAFGTATLILENSKNIEKGEYSYLTINDVDRTKNEPCIFPKKDNNRYANIPQANFSKIPGSPIAYWVSKRMIDSFGKNNSLKEITDLKQGMATTNNNLFMRNWWEVSKNKIGFSHSNKEEAIKAKSKWIPYSKGGSLRKWYGNNQHIVNFENNGKTICDYIDNTPGVKVKSNGRVINRSSYYKRALTWSLTSSSSFGVRYRPNGFIFDVNGMSIFPETEEKLAFLIGFLNSSLAFEYLKILNPTMAFQKGDLEKLPIDYNYQDIQSSYASECIKIVKGDWDSFETSWDFKNTPLFNNQNSLFKAYNKWCNQVSNDFFKLHSYEEEFNRIFIDIYGFQEELTPEVALKDITILQNELDRNAIEKLEQTYRKNGKNAIELPIDKTEILSQFVSYCIGVFLGRYRLDLPGLNIAHPNPTETEISSYQYNGHTIEIDEDGILPMMGEDCAFPDDALVRTKDIIHAIWREETLTENLNFLHECLGMDLHKWLTEKFWGYHTSMYKKKPIYWLFSSNAKNPQNAAFKVLVYMHRMDKYTVQKIQRNYLHPHQEYIKREITKLIENEENLSKQEQKRLEQYQNWELECRDYNEVLKELANQQIEFDLDDGVDVNYAKFEGAVAII